MTALISGSREAGGRRGLRPAMTPMAWVIWQQHRARLLWLGALLLAIGTGLLVAGIKLHRLYAAEIRPGCFGSSAGSALCQPRQTPFTMGRAQDYSIHVIPVMQLVPVIIGVFLGAPLLAREPIAAQTTRLADRWEPGFFDNTALTAAAAALLAFAIGVLAGGTLLAVLVLGAAIVGLIRYRRA